MTNNNEKIDISLSRRRVLGGLGAIGVASAGAGLGTTAFFSDSETFENNTIATGELDLLVDWQQTYDFGEGRQFVSAHPDHDGDRGSCGFRTKNSASGSTPRCISHIYRSYTGMDSSRTTPTAVRSN